MLFLGKDAVAFKVCHDVACNDMFQHLAGNAGKGDRTVIGWFVSLTFLVDWGYVG